jgi:hypothetical protein
MISAPFLIEFSVAVLRLCLIGFVGFSRVLNCVFMSLRYLPGPGFYPQMLPSPMIPSPTSDRSHCGPRYEERMPYNEQALPYVSRRMRHRMTMMSVRLLRSPFATYRCKLSPARFTLTHSRPLSGMKNRGFLSPERLHFSLTIISVQHSHQRSMK